MKPEEINVVVLGASNKPERYSNMAVKLLKEKGYNVIPIHPLLDEIEGFPVVHYLKDVLDNIHSLTLYVGPKHISPVIHDIIKMKPGRVIMNPGTESEELKDKLFQYNIPFFEACTLVLLKTGQF